MARARIRVEGGVGGGLQAFWGRRCRPTVVVASEMAGQDAARDARGPSWCEFAGTFSWPDGGSVAVVRRQEGRGSARNLARAPLNWASQGQRWGRCKVRRRAERVSLPAMEKKRRRRVLVVTICWPRPMRAVQRARLWAITCTASQAPFGRLRIGGEAARGEMVQPHAVLEVSDGFSISAWRRWSASSSRVSPSRSVMKP